MKKLAGLASAVVVVVLLAQSLLCRNDGPGSPLLPAAEQAALRDAPNSDGSDLNAQSARQVLSGLKDQGASELPEVAGAPVQVPGQAEASVPEASAIAPGKDLSPKFSDPVRVQIILKIVSAVYNGSPLPFPKDGVVFDNREGRLPAKPSGYYHEYTVLPPEGSTMTLTVGDQTFQISPPQGHRGAERLIIGGGQVLYYSPDHYRTFLQLQVIR